MVPADILRLDLQPSQQLQLGLLTEMTIETAEDLAGHGEAWTAWRDGRPIALMGLRESFPGVQAVAWALLSTTIGAAHLAITRHARRRIAASPCIRIDALVRAACPAEGAWCRAVGLEPEALIRRYGAQSEDHLVYARVR